MSQKISILALGGLEISQHQIDTLSIYCETKDSSRKDVFCIYVSADEDPANNKQQLDFLICDDVGRVKYFSDVGQAIKKVGEAIGLDRMGVQLSRVAVCWTNYAQKMPPADIEKAAAARLIQLDKMLSKSIAEREKIGRQMQSIYSVQATSELWGIKYADLAGQNAVITANIAEIERQKAALPLVSLKPDA